MTTAASCFDPWLAGSIALDALAAVQGGAAALAARRERRLAALLQAAARGSRFWRERLRGAGGGLARIAPVAKRELMNEFDRWVADPRLRLGPLRNFLADPSRVGEAFGDAFIVWESSGSTGEPGIFVQDARAMAVYDALEALRRPARWFDPGYVGERIAFIGAIDGHFASHVTANRMRRLNPIMASNLHEVSFLQPTASLSAQLERLSPSVVSTYPTMAVLLAEEAHAGRLRIAPREVWTGGETLTAGMRRFIERQFGCALVDSYGASEFLALAAQCRCGSLHLNSDWAILEPVDEHFQPVPAGVPGHTTLLTNLANHVQPLIRYDIGDGVLVHREACACGSPLPVIEVEGRGDDMLLLRPPDGERVRLLPLALTTVLEDEAGVFDFQLAQVRAQDGAGTPASCSGWWRCTALRRPFQLGFPCEAVPRGLGQRLLVARAGDQQVVERDGAGQPLLGRGDEQAPHARAPTWRSRMRRAASCSVALATTVMTSCLQRDPMSMRCSWVRKVGWASARRRACGWDEMRPAPSGRNARRPGRQARSCGTACARPCSPSWRSSRR